ncbi:MAG: phenylacetate-CoA ligase [Thermomicrobiales bacterium]|nr:phenylacetate-CoA ligase [Thermomicrobiales bacterium]
MMWNAEAETLPRGQLEVLQLERLRETVTRVLVAGTPLSDRLRAAGIGTGEDVGSLADLRRLPFTQKTDLREHYPFGLFAVPPERLVRVHASSGTRGKPTVVGYTRRDLDVWNEVMARCLVMAGVRPGMVAHNAYGYGLFTGGLGFHQGAEFMGCVVVPVAGGMTERQVMLLQDLGAQALFATPSYALSIAEAIERAGIDRRSLKLEVGVFGAEPWTEEMRGEIERRLNLRAMNMYGLSEIIGPGVAAECAEGWGGSHIQEDHFLPEVVDPETGEPLPPGQEGELVFTTLTKEALPLIRYRTGDISALDAAPCFCGRTTVKMGRIRGRYDDMLIVRGVNLYPSEVERILLSTGEVAPYYQIVLDRPRAMDEMTVLCEPVRADVDRTELQGRLEHALQAETGLSMVVQVLPRDGVARSEGKAIRVVDHRPR